MDFRRDPGEYYPGGRVIARGDTAPGQVVVPLDKTLTKEDIAAEAKSVGDALALKADKATTYTKTETDAKVALTPVYSQWVCNPPALNGEMLSIVELEDMYELRADDYPISAVVKTGGETSLTFSDRGVTAIRPVIGYALGTQSDKPLQPKGDYALRSELPSVPVQSVNGKIGAVVLTGEDIRWQNGGGTIASEITLSNSLISTLRATKVSTHALAGQSFDFAAMSGMYYAVKALVTALGGTVANFPNFQVN